jgi:hypothetical protein
LRRGTYSPIIRRAETMETKTVHELAEAAPWNHEDRPRPVETTTNGDFRPPWDVLDTFAPDRLSPNPMSGEVWQYMGTWQGRGGEWIEFRHRDLDDVFAILRGAPEDGATPWRLVGANRWEREAVRVATFPADSPGGFPRRVQYLVSVHAKRYNEGGYRVNARAYRLGPAPCERCEDTRVVCEGTRASGDAIMGDCPRCCPEWDPAGALEAQGLA